MRVQMEDDHHSRNKDRLPLLYIKVWLPWNRGLFYFLFFLNFLYQRPNSIVSLGTSKSQPNLVCKLLHRIGKLFKLGSKVLRTGAGVLPVLQNVTVGSARLRPRPFGIRCGRAVRRGRRCDKRKERRNRCVRLRRHGSDDDLRGLAPAKKPTSKGWL